jgi:hypothetical protein
MTASPTTEEMVEGGLRSSLLGIVINLALALVKCLTGLIGHSFALLADGVESFLDVISSSVVYYGLRLAIKPPDKDHPYGHGKADPIAAAVVGVAMIAAAFGIAAESINLIRTPHKLPQAYTLWVLICVVPFAVTIRCRSWPKNRELSPARGRLASFERCYCLGVCLYRNLGRALDGRSDGRRLGRPVCGPGDPSGGLAAAPPPGCRVAGHCARTGD